MKYTKEDIEKIKSDPMMRLLSLFAGKDFDELIEEIESEQNEDNIYHNNKKETIKNQSPNISVNLKPATIEKCSLPIGKDEYAFIVKCACALNDSIAKAKQIGFSDINTKDLTLVGAPIAMIYTLLRSLINPNFAARFVGGFPNEGSDYFWRLYDDQTRIY